MGGCRLQQECTKIFVSVTLSEIWTLILLYRSVNKAGALGSLKYSVETTRSPEPTDSSEQSTHQASPNETGKEPPDSEASPSEKAASNDPIDPIKWFGMFVPKALRDAQSSFKSVISNVPSLVSIAEEIRQVEAEVESLRGKLKAHEHT